MLKKSGGFLCVILIFMLISGCAWSDTSSLSPIPQDNKQESILQGTVYDASMNSITIITDTFETYTFSTLNNKDLVQSKNGIVVGYPVIIHYVGSIDNCTSIMVMDYSNCTVEEQAHHRMMVMSLEEKVGQMFIVRCPEKDSVADIPDFHLGGYILFARDFQDKTKEDIIHTIQSYQEVSAIPMIIGVDEEGGSVNRISLYSSFRDTPFQSPQQLFREGGWERIKSDTVEKSRLLKELGINVNLAPVCDVSEDSSDYIYSRSFGKNSEQTALYVRNVVSSMQGENVGCVLKHFPGYGNNRDTHTGIAYDYRPYSVFESSDFLPFKAGIDVGAGAVLVSHNIVSCMDANMPASLSLNVHRILRERLNFKGVIMTDDLYMDAIKQFIDKNKAAVYAVLAGNDMLCCTDFEIQIPAVIEAVKNETISITMINEAVERILVWKMNIGILS